MKQHVLMAALLVLVPLVTVSAEDPSPTITDAEFADLVKQIDDVQDTILGLVSGLTDEQWNFRQNPSRWSVGECVEHISRSERALLERIKNLIAGPPDPEWYTRSDGKLAIIRQLVPMRGPQGQGGVKAPEEIQPTEQWGRARAIQEFYKSHGEVRAYIETMDRHIKDRTMESTVPQFGWMNAYDWLNLIPLHLVRHSKQIIEVKEDPNYPKKVESASAQTK